MIQFLLAIATHPLTPVFVYVAQSQFGIHAPVGPISDTSGHQRLLEEEVDEADYAWAEWIGLILSILIPVLIWYIVATQYKTKVVDQRDPFPSSVPEQYSLSNDRSFLFPICSCCDDIQYFLHGCCCLDVRMGDNFAMSGVNTYWAIVIIALIVYCIYQIVAGIMTWAIQEVIMSSFGTGNLESARASRAMNGDSGGSHVAWFIVNFFFAFYLASQRGKLREKLGGAADKFPNDFICYWCCQCCTVIQDARQLDAATGTRVECCCKLIKQSNEAIGGQMVVGAPITVVGSVVEPSK